MKKTSKIVLQKGFTAVELLITLFIAAVFLFAGYQLYTQVIRDGKDADKIARLSNEVYKIMREKSAQVTALNSTGCSGSISLPAAPTSPATVAGIPNVTTTVSYSCPLGTSTVYDLFLVKVSASYSDSSGVTKKVEHATYAN